MLTLCLVLGMVSMTVFAKGDIPLEYSGGAATLSNITPADIVVATFEELPDTVLYQGYDFGEITLQTEINLPQTLTGTDTGNDPVSIRGVTWQSNP